MNSRFELRPWIPLLIAVAPALGYGLAYVHEQGYCAVYHIPFDLIHLDLTTILVAIAASLGGMTLLIWITFLTMTIPLYISATKKNIYFSLIFFLFFVLPFGLLYLAVEEFKQLLIAFLLFVFFIFAFPRILPWLIRKFPRRRQRLDIPIVRWLNNKYLRYGYIVTLVIIFIFVCTYLAGRSEAWKKEIFLVPSSNPELVVLKIYDDNIICGKLVQESDKIGLGPTIDLLRLNDISNLTLTPIKVKLSFTQYLK
jgi:hypothetical protein